jgi:formylmethanofuran dehydrogenase subunit E
MEDRWETQKSTRRRFIRNCAALSIGAFAGTGLFAGVAGGQSAQTAEKTGAGGEKPLGQPPVRIPDVSIRMRSPDSFLVGITASEVIEIKFADVLKFHGYCAGGVAFSFRAAQEAFKILYGESLPIRQNFKVQTSHHCCQAGALAYITGARTDFGAISSRGDLVLLPEDMKKIVFMDKKTGRKVELIARFNPHDIFAPLFQKVRKDPSFAPQVQKTLNDAVHEYMSVPAEKLFLFTPSSL